MIFAQRTQKCPESYTGVTFYPRREGGAHIKGSWEENGPLM